MKRLAMAFSGHSNSGKTTLILKVAKKFIEDGLKVSIIKHDPKDKAKFDVEGKDSFKFNELGADVVVLSPTRTTLFKKESLDLEDTVRILGDFDILLVEGLKTLPLPRLGVFKDEIDESYFEYLNAVASKKNSLPSDITHLNLDDIDAICEWILQNAKKV